MSMAVSAGVHGDVHAEPPGSWAAGFGEGGDFVFQDCVEGGVLMADARGEVGI